MISILGVLSPPVSPANAAESVADWFRHDHISPINPGDGHMRIFQENLAVAGSGTKLVTDAHIAALAMITPRRLVPFIDCQNAYRRARDVFFTGSQSGRLAIWRWWTF